MRFSPLPFLLTGLLLSLQAAAITNIESIATVADKQGIETNIDLSVLYQRGNTDYSHYAAGVRIIDFNDQRQRILLLDREYADSSREKSIDSFFTHLRHVWLRDSPLDYEAFIQYQTDDFTFLRHRSLIGTGIKYTIIPANDTHALHAGMGAYYTAERYKNDMEKRERNSWRGNFYATYRIFSLANSTLMNTLYIQPGFNRFSDVYALNDFRLESFINQHLSLFISISHSYKSRPFSDNKTTDSSSRAGLSLRF